MSVETQEAGSALYEIAGDAGTRKRFLRMAGAGAAASLSAFVAACGSQTSSPKGGGSVPDQGVTTGGKPAQSDTSEKPTDVEILNYALMLEKFEVSFYDKAEATGLLKGRAAEVIKRIGVNEHRHAATVADILEEQGGQPVPAPVTKFDLPDAGAILRLTSMFENLGASAYLGQAPNIRSKAILADALSIHTIEARQAAVVNDLIGRDPTPDEAFAKPRTMQEVLTMVKPFLAA
jgi:hypothetical protein